MTELVFLAQFHGISSVESEDILDCNLGTISDIGFADGSGHPISRRPPQPEKLPYKDFCHDKFLTISRDGSCGGIGFAKVREAFVYDFYMRGDIDFTGLQIFLDLSEHAFRLYADYLGTTPPVGVLDSSKGWGGGVLFRLAAKEFRYPLPRGSADPWGHEKAVGELKSVARFAIERLEVLKLADPLGRSIAVGDGQALAERDLLSPLIL